MIKNTLTALWNRPSVRIVLALGTLAALVLTAGAPGCFGC